MKEVLIHIGLTQLATTLSLIIQEYIFIDEWKVLKSKFVEKLKFHEVENSNYTGHQIKKHHATNNH